MAQVLKKEIKDKIIEATKNEVLKKGVKDPSLREIAANAGITVGNLYRYFKCKDDIINSITSPTLIKLNEMVKAVTNYQVSFENDLSLVEFNSDDLMEMLNQLASGLAKLYVENKEAMIILIKYSKEVSYIKDWFKNIVSILISKNKQLNLEDEELNSELSRTIASSVIAGIEECLLSNNLSLNEIERLLKIYFRAFVSMLEIEGE